MSVNFYGNSVAFQEDPEFEPEVYADQFTNDRALPTVEKVLSGQSTTPLSLPLSTP